MVVSYAGISSLRLSAFLWDWSANGANYESLGHRPRKGIRSFRKALKARNNSASTTGTSACYSAPSALGPFNGFHLGRWPRLSYFRAVGAPIPGFHIFAPLALRSQALFRAVGASIPRFYFRAVGAPTQGITDAPPTDDFGFRGKAISLMLLSGLEQCQ